MRKKIAMTIFAVLLTMQATAQIYRHYEPPRYNRTGSEHYFGLRVGLNVASISSGDVDYDADSYSGLYLGMAYGVQLAQRAPVWLELGLGYSEKGGVSRLDGELIKYRMSYLEVPLTVKYDIELSRLHLQPFLGGYLATGIAGKTKDYRTRDAYSTFDLFKRFDGGLRLGCGLEFQMIYAEVGFDFGLANVSEDDFDTAHNRCFFLRAGVNF